MEQYSLVQPYQSSYLVNGPTNEEYARLSHNANINTQYDCTQHPHSHNSTPVSPDSQYSNLSNKRSDKSTIKKTTGQ